MKDLVLSMVVAATEYHVIGQGGRLPWHLPSDLRRFRQITLHAGTMIMGRKTYESILAHNGKPLPERMHLVLSRRIRGEPVPDLVQFVSSPDEALDEVGRNGRRACIIGGGEIFKLFLSLETPRVTRVYVTTVYSKPALGDTFFPSIDPGTWRCTGCSSRRLWDPQDDYETSYHMYERLSSSLQKLWREDEEESLYWDIKKGIL